MTSEPKAASWWHTIPGALAGGAALITAITGLLVVVHQAGWLSARDSTDASVPQSQPVGAPASKASGHAAAPALVPVLREVTLGSAVFTLLGVQTQTRTPETAAVRINVRVLNRSPYALNFWNASFRLLVDDVPRAPTSDLNQVVEGNSAHDGDVEFTFPSQATALTLQIRFAEEVANIPLQRTAR